MVESERTFVDEKVCNNPPRHGITSCSAAQQPAAPLLKPAIAQSIDCLHLAFPIA